MMLCIMMFHYFCTFCGTKDNFRWFNKWIVDTLIRSYRFSLVHHPVLVVYVTYKIAVNTDVSLGLRCTFSGLWLSFCPKNNEDITSYMLFKSNTASNIKLSRHFRHVNRWPWVPKLIDSTTQHTVNGWHKYLLWHICQLPEVQVTPNCFGKSARARKL